MNRDPRKKVWIWMFLTLIFNGRQVARGELEELCEDETIHTHYCPMRPGSSFKLDQNWTLPFDVCESDLLPYCITAPRPTTTVKPTSLALVPPTATTAAAAATTTVTTTTMKATLTEPPTTTTTTTLHVPPPTEGHEGEECEEERSRCDMSTSWLTSKIAVDINLLKAHSTVPIPNVSEPVHGHDFQYPSASIVEFHDAFKNFPIFNPHSVSHHPMEEEGRLEGRAGNAAAGEASAHAQHWQQVDPNGKASAGREDLELPEGMGGNAAGGASAHAQHWQHVEHPVEKDSGRRKDVKFRDLPLQDKYWKTLADVWKAEKRFQALAHRQQRLLDLEHARQSHAHHHQQQQYKDAGKGQGQYSRQHPQNTGSNMNIFWDYFRPM